MTQPTTDLESLIRRLAGRDDATVRGAPDPLADPSGDVGRLLDEVRRRTRALLDGPGLADGMSPGPPSGGTPAVPFGTTLGLRGGRAALGGWLLLAAIVAATATLTAGAAHRLSARSAAERSEEQARRIVAEVRDQLAARAAAELPAPGALDPAAASATATDEALRRVEAGLVAVRDRLDAIGRMATPPAPRDDRVRPIAAEAPPAAAPGPGPEMAADIAAIRREVAAAEAATSRQIQEMRTVLHEVNAVVRRVLSRPQPAGNANVGPLLAITIQALVNNLQHPSSQVRGEAVEKLLQLGTPARSAVPALQQQHAREVDQNVRAAIEAAISVLSSN